jgi:hypothetical protein
VAGRIIGGDFTYVDSIAPNRKISFKISLLDTFRDLGKPEVYGTP